MKTIAQSDPGLLAEVGKKRMKENEELLRTDDRLKVEDRVLYLLLVLVLCSLFLL